MERGYGWLQQRRSQLLGAIGVAAGCVLCYKLYRWKVLSNTQAALQQLSHTLQKYVALGGDVADMATLVVRDLRDYLLSDSDDVPQSLRQLLKIMEREELQGSVRKLTGSIMQGLAAASPSLGEASSAGNLVDKVLEAFLSDRGRSLVGLAVSVYARSSTSVVCDYLERSTRERPSHVPASATTAGGSLARDIFELFTTPQGERLLQVLCESSIKNAVGVYLDKTVGYNVYDDMLSSLSNPQHLQAFTQLSSAVTSVMCKEAITNLFKAYVESQQQVPPPEERSDWTRGQSTSVTSQAVFRSNGSQWVSFVSEASRSPEMRSLTLDLAKCGTREAVGTLLDCGASRLQSLCVSGSMRAYMHRLYVMMSVVVFLGMYAISAKTIVL